MRQCAGRGSRLNPVGWLLGCLVGWVSRMEQDKNELMQVRAYRHSDCLVHRLCMYRDSTCIIYGWCVGWLGGCLVGEVGWWVGGLMGGWLVGWVIAWCVGWLIGWWIGWWVIAWCDGWLVGWLGDCLVFCVTFLFLSLLRWSNCVSALQHNAFSQGYDTTGEPGEPL